MTRVGGIHHVTAIAGDPQENLDHYADVLGLRLVKRSVNQDDVHTYHLYYADAEAHPGSTLTFFPWAGGRRGRSGVGMVHEVVLAVPPASLAYWRERLEANGSHVDKVPDRFGESTLAWRDPHGLHLAITGTAQADERAFTPWERGPVPAEHQVRGLHAVRMVVPDAGASLALAEATLGMTRVGEEDGWTRVVGREPWCGGLDVRESDERHPGSLGPGTVHHVAWRVRDEAEEQALRSAVADAGRRPTEVIDRFWFRSVYFREPGGVLFELATDRPGFAIDEPLDRLGEALVLPPWLEDERAEIEAALPELTLPHERR